MLIDVAVEGMDVLDCRMTGLRKRDHEFYAEQIMSTDLENNSRGDARAMRVGH